MSLPPRSCVCRSTGLTRSEERRLAMTRVALFAAMLAVAATAHAERFTYHGTLQDGGQLAEGRYDLQLTLYPAAHGGAPLAAPTRLYGVEVHAGNFSTDVDF